VRKPRGPQSRPGLPGSKQFRGPFHLGASKDTNKQRQLRKVSIDRKLPRQGQKLDIFQFRLLRSWRLANQKRLAVLDEFIDLCNVQIRSVKRNTEATASLAEETDAFRHRSQNFARSVPSTNRSSGLRYRATSSGLHSARTYSYRSGHLYSWNLFQFAG